MWGGTVWYHVCVQTVRLNAKVLSYLLLGRLPSSNILFRNVIAGSLGVVNIRHNVHACTYSIYYLFTIYLFSIMNWTA